MRTAARTDSNHAEISNCFKAFGFSVKDVSRLKGFCDIVVAKNGRTYLVEIKDGSKPRSKQKLTEKEQDFHDSWNDEVYIITSIEDVQNFNKRLAIS